MSTKIEKNSSSFGMLFDPTTSNKLLESAFYMSIEPYELLEIFIEEVYAQIFGED